MNLSLLIISQAAEHRMFVGIVAWCLLVCLYISGILLGLIIDFSETKRAGLGLLLDKYSPIVLAINETGLDDSTGYSHTL